MTITIDPETANRILLFLTCIALMITLVVMFAMHLNREADIREENTRRLNELRNMDDLKY